MKLRFPHIMFIAFFCYLSGYILLKSILGVPEVSTVHTIMVVVFSLLFASGIGAISGNKTLIFTFRESGIILFRVLALVLIALGVILMFAGYERTGIPEDVISDFGYFLWLIPCIVGTMLLLYSCKFKLEVLYLSDR